MPTIKEYPKAHMRAILENPKIDTTDKKNLDKADKQSKPHFFKEVMPIVEKHCQHLITVADFKKAKIVPREVVKIIFEKLKI